MKWNNCKIFQDSCSNPEVQYTMRNRDPVFNTRRVWHTNGGVLCAESDTLTASAIISNTFLALPKRLSNANSFSQT